MNKRILFLILPLLLAAVLYGGYYGWRRMHVSPQTGVMSDAGMTHETDSGPADQAAPAPESGDDGRQVLYWHDPMYPQHKFDKPGASPFMDMQLVPVYADEGGEAAGTVSIDPRVLQNLGVRYAVAERGPLMRELSAAGRIAADERRVELVQVRAAGWVERLSVRALNEPVRRGQLLAEVYSPEIHAAQQEFLLALRLAQAQPAERTLLDAARARLSFLGLSAAQIAALEQRGEVQRRVAYHAPRAGIVSELGVREGMQVAPGMTLFGLTDLSQVWGLAEVPEAQAGWIAAGNAVELRLPAYPGELFRGQVDYVYPELMTETRTLKLRAVLANPDGRLKPGMYAELRIRAATAEEALLVPTEAVIRTGVRSLVIVSDAEGQFRPVEVTTGAESGERTQILSGLEAGQRIVASGQFLIDSESSLRSALDRFGTPAAAEQGTEAGEAAQPAEQDPPAATPHADHVHGAQP